MSVWQFLILVGLLMMILGRTVLEDDADWARVFIRFIGSVCVVTGFVWLCVLIDLRAWT